MKKTIIAHESDGRESYMLAMTFEVPDDDFDLVGAIKKASTAICNTPKGRTTYENNNRRFDWGDFADCATSATCEPFGFKLVSVGPADITVDWGMSLVDENQLFCFHRPT